jgi:hypothetical protein
MFLPSSRHQHPNKEKAQTHPRVFITAERSIEKTYSHSSLRTRIIAATTVADH